MQYEPAPGEQGPELHPQLLYYSDVNAYEVWNEVSEAAIDVRVMALAKIQGCNLPESRGVDWALYQPDSGGDRKILLVSDERNDSIYPEIRLITNATFGSKYGFQWHTSTFILDSTNCAQYFEDTEMDDLYVKHTAQIIRENIGRIGVYNYARTAQHYGLKTALKRPWRFRKERIPVAPFGNAGNPFDQRYALAKAYVILQEIAFRSPIQSGSQKRIRTFS